MMKAEAEKEKTREERYTSTRMKTLQITRRGQALVSRSVLCICCALCSMQQTDACDMIRGNNEQ